MKKINIRKLYYLVRHRYLTIETVVVVVALVIGAGWAWGSVQMMQRNYQLQKNIDSKMREEQLTELEVQNLKFQRTYYQSTEYQELTVRERLGIVASGEKVLFLPENSAAAKLAGKQTAQKDTGLAPNQGGNFQLWINFLFGGGHQKP